MPTETTVTYPLIHDLKITFSVYEDRLVLHGVRGAHGPVAMLLTRRMVLMVLGRLLANLPQLADLAQTPAAYWQDVLKMAHQHAMEAKHKTDELARQAAATEATQAEGDDAAPQEPAPAPAIFLATGIALQLKGKESLLAFSGLPMPSAMTKPSPHEPILAVQLQSDHVHQLIHLLITKAHEAEWHLPLELPWLESPEEQHSTSVGSSLLH